VAPMRLDRTKLVSLLVFTAFAVALVSPLLFGGKIYYFRDFGRYYQPIKEYCLERMAGGEIPLWIPGMNCGTPVHAELVHGLLYPGNLLLFAGVSVGWGLYFAVHLVLAAVGMRALALRLGAGPEGALAAGIAFAGSGYYVSQLNHVPYATAAAWAPLIVWLCLGAGEKRRFTIAALAAAFAMAALAGEPFTILLTLVFAGILVLAGHAGPRLPALLRIGTAGVIGLLIATPALVPAAMQVAESVRAGGIEVASDGFGSLHPARLVTVFSPEALGRLQHIFVDRYPIPLIGDVELPPPILLGVHLGALTLIAVLGAPVRRSRAARLFAIVAGVFTLLSLGSYLGVATLLTKFVPGLSTFRYPDKYWFVVTLAAVGLLSVSFSGLRTRRTLVTALVLAGVSILVGGVFGRFTEGLIGAVPFLLVAAAFRLPGAFWGRALVAILTAELLFFGLRHHGVSNPGDLDPMNGLGAVLVKHRPGRIFVDFQFPHIEFERDVQNQTEMLSRRLESLSGVPDGFHYTMGYDPIEPLARIPQFFGLPEKLTPQMRTRLFHRLLRLSSNTHSITNVDLSDDVQVSGVIHYGPRSISVYAYGQPLPRARLYGNTTYVPDVEAGRKTLHDLEFDPFDVLILEGDGTPETNGTPNGHVLWEEDGDREVRLRVVTDRPAWLFLSDSWARAWKAWVDGEPAKVEIGLIAFRAVRVPAGESVVLFRYEPGWLNVVPVTAGAGLLLLLGSLLIHWIPRRNSGAEPLAGPLAGPRV